MLKTFRALSVAFASLCATVARAEGSHWGWLQPVISPMGREIDHLYMIIMWIVLALFFLTQGVLIFCIIFFRQRKGRKASSFHGSNALELIWTLIPALILGILTILSGSLWNRIRISFPKDNGATVVQVYGEQFAWNFRYPGKDGVFGTPDDVMTLNELHVPVNHKVILKFSSKDVIHSFFIPEARVKQDVVPGLLTRFWFQVDRLCVWDRKTNQRVFLSEEEFNQKKVAVDGFEFKSKVISDNGLRSYSYEPKEDGGGKATFLENGKLSQGRAEDAELIYHPLEIGCAQLCGTLHFGMRGQVYVQTPAQFDAWLQNASANNATSLHKWNDIWDANHPDFNKPNL